MGCCVLNLLYKLDNSLVEICFFYTLKLRVGDWLSMSTNSPQLQFIIEILDFPKTKAKGVVFVKGLWYETLGSLGLPFDLNQSLVFPGWSRLDGAYSFPCSLYFDMPLLVGLFIGKQRRGRLVSWVNKDSLDRIRWLLEITKKEHNHKILFSAKNMQDLGASPFPYIVPVIPCPLPKELVKGEHFVLADLLKSIPAAPLQIAFTSGEIFMIYRVWFTNLPLILGTKSLYFRDKIYSPLSRINLPTNKG